MKKIIVQIKKYFLILSIFLISSHIQVFSQTLWPSEVQQLNEQREIISNLINEIGIMKDNIGKSVTAIEDKEVGAYFDNYNSSLNSLKEKYIAYMQKEQDYYSRMLPKRYMSELTYMYTGESSEIREIVSLVRSKDEAVLFKLEKMTDFIKYYSDRKLTGLDKSRPYSRLLSEAQLQEWNNCVIYLANRFDKKLEAKTLTEIKTLYKNHLSQLVVSFNKSVNSGDIMEYAFRYGMLDSEKNGIRVVLRSMKDDAMVRTITEDIMDHLTKFKFELQGLKYYDSEIITKELLGLTTMKRARRVEEIIKLNNGAQEFIKDLKKLDRPSRDYMFNHITGGVWAFAGLGAIATAAYISNVSAENHFNPAYTMSNRDLAIIGNKIKDGTAKKISEKWFGADIIKR